MNFNHRIIEGDEEQAVIADIMARIPGLNAADANPERWQKGWGEILDRFKASGDIADLRPQYIRANQPVRLGGRFVMPEDPDIEAKWYSDFFFGIAQKWFEPHEQIWEYGCGSAHNIATLAGMFPNKRIVGCDWAAASADIIWEINKRYRNAWPARFDFFHPIAEKDGDAAKAAIFTVGALEQTGRRWMPFLEYLLHAKPAICLHIEPIAEWYDPFNRVDATALAAHDARGFWRGFPAELQRRRGMGQVEILHMERTGFGSLFCEGYSQIVWKPI